MPDFGPFPDPPDMTEADPVIPVPLEIKIPDLNIQSGTVAVSWCVSPELLKLLADHNNHDPQVVIVTATTKRPRYHLTKESRTVVPLKDALAYIEFRSAGENNIWAFVPVEMKTKDVKNKFLSRSEGSYSTTILDLNGEDWDWYLNQDTRLQKSPPIKVFLPDGAFAKEPSEFEKDWVNWLFRTKCVDQCAFRRRRMFAYTLQVLVFSFFMFLKSWVTLASAFVGSRNFSFKLLTQPLTYGLSDSDELFGDGTIFIREVPDAENPFSGRYRVKDRKEITVVDEIKHIFRKFWALPFMPVALVVEGLFALWVVSTNFVVLWIALSLVAAVILFFVGCYLYDKWLERKEEDLKNQTPWYLTEEEVDFMLCSNPNKVKSLADLPSNKRTLRLRFMNLKSKVCRPFSV